MFFDEPEFPDLEKYKNREEIVVLFVGQIGLMELWNTGQKEAHGGMKILYNEKIEEAINEVNNGISSEKDTDREIITSHDMDSGSQSFTKLSDFLEQAIQRFHKRYGGKWPG